jgi:hypothetical protein
VEPGVFSALCETHSQAKQLRMGKSVLFHTKFPLY